MGLARGKLHHVNDAVKIKPRSPAQYRRLTGAPALVHKHACVALEHRNRIILGDVGDIDHLQGNATLPHRRLGRAYVHPAIDLHRVDGDDVRPKLHGHFVCQRALTRGSGTHDAYDGCARAYRGLEALAHLGSPTIGPRRYQVRASSTRTSTSLPTRSWAL